MADVVTVQPSAVAQERVSCFAHPSAEYQNRAPGVYTSPFIEGEGEQIPGDTLATANVKRENVYVRLENGLCLSGVAWGASEEECTLRILSLHGWLDNAASFRFLAPLLITALQQRDNNVRVRMVCLDMPGHGHSSHRPPSAAYLSGYMARDTALVVRKLWGPSNSSISSSDEEKDAEKQTKQKKVMRRFSLLSHSMGAAVSAMLCALLPEQVDRAVFLDHLGHSTFSPESTLSALRGALADEERFGGSSALPLPKLYRSRDEAVQVMCARNPHIAPHSALALVSRSMVNAQTPQRGVYFVHDPRLRSRSIMRFSEEEIRAALREIHAPVLMVWAERRNYALDFDLLREREECIKDFRKVNVRGGHHVHMDDPNEVLPHIVSFFQEKPVDTKE
mmetsp:Transcript_33974/g.85270  ORF Transcript_33974/g.85270 Transcript_33974/m.85270 type:complete len:393 (-) Transcript_33974:26-1204(-)